MPTYLLPELPYDLGALEPYISARVLQLHHDQHHAAYVKGANVALERLEEARARGDVTTLPALERALAFNVSGHVLHSIFWSNLAPHRGGGGGPEGALASAIDRDFGSLEAFRAQLTAAAATVMGSGWAALCWEPLGRKLIVSQIHDHQSNGAQGSAPLLVLDAWEHAYYLQYENRKNEFFDAVWSLWNWADVGHRFEAARATIVHGLAARPHAR